MDIKLEWARPVPLEDGDKYDLIYHIDDFWGETIPKEPGIYIFIENMEVH